MNHHVTYDQVRRRLDENLLEYSSIDIGGDAGIIVSQRGGRIFGPFVGENQESILWINKPFTNSGEFRQFLVSGDWNLGGDRVWIAPEHRYNVKDRFDFLGTYVVPEQVDPGHYCLESSNTGCWLKEDAELVVYGVEAEPKQLRIERHIVAAADPLRELSNYDEIISGVAYSGFLHEVCLSEKVNDAVNAELWDIAQVNPGGNVYVSVLDGATRADFYEPVDDAHYTVFPQYTRIKIDGQRMFKIGYKAARFLGRVAYHNSMDDGNEYLFVRAFFSNPAATYTMEPPEVPGDRGYPIQVFNDDGMYGGFGEIECSGQAIGGETGRSTSDDQVCNWFYVGSNESLGRIAKILIGVKLQG